MKYLINLIFYILSAPNNIAMFANITYGRRETFNIRKSTLIVITHPFTIPKTSLVSPWAAAHNTDVICH